jgi:hypothetical protein
MSSEEKGRAMSRSRWWDQVLCLAHWNQARPLRRALWLLWYALLLLPLLSLADTPADPVPPRVLIVGGGPSPEYNQVAIESNVRYVGGLLPPGSVRTTLFADGDLQRETVLYEEEAKTLSPGEKVLGLLLEGENGDSASTLHYRKPNLGGALDGASRRTDIDKAFTRLAQEETDTKPPLPLLLYFTGHGSPGSSHNMDNNVYDLWGKEERLSVRDLAQDIARLPADVPTTIVMVQCFSGAFGNLLFEGGDPQGKVIDRDIAGFFATIKERVAAGCTPAVNEAEYRDFTSYFFAALTGRDRVGRSVTGADYNHDGRVGMDEAYCYALANDDSIDIPVCTSDVFLRRFVLAPDTQVIQTRFSLIHSWASPAQKAALDALSSRLKLRGEDRLKVAYNREGQEGGDNAARDNVRETGRRFNTLREDDRRILLGRWPDLRNSDTSEYAKAKTEAVAELGRQIADGKWKDLLDTANALDKAEEDEYTAELAEARLLRFIRLGKSVVLAHTLHETGDVATKARFDHLIEAEERTLLPPVDALHQADLTPQPPSLAARSSLRNGVTKPCPCGQYP